MIESVSPIELDASSGGGSTVGSIFGQVGGASTGGGRGSAAGAVLGTVLGGTLGHQAGITTKPGLEIWGKLDDEDGKSAYVMQPGKPVVSIVRFNPKFLCWSNSILLKATLVMAFRETWALTKLAVLARKRSI